VPSAEVTAEAVRPAQRALIEIQHRREAEERYAAAEAEARAEELARWHTGDTNAEQANTATGESTPASGRDGKAFCGGLFGVAKRASGPVWILLPCPQTRRIERL
jgi:hypothetical protein